MVDLFVGSPEPQLFRVHKKIICEKIPYFKTMFESGFKEALENKATFPEDDPEVFDNLIQWVYTDQLGGPILAIPNIRNTSRLYVLFDKICLPGLKDELLDIVRSSHYK